MDRATSENEIALESKPAEATANGRKSRMLAVRHVAQLLGIHESTVRMWADSGVLESYRLGPRQDRRIPFESVMHTLEAARSWPRYGPHRGQQQGNVRL